MERLDAFMARANAAYYATHDPFQDFTTSPEITQVFGELLGAWAAVMWEAMGHPDPVLLVECGPGRGTLMADALRAAARVAPRFRQALRVHFIETSPRLCAQQAERVPDAHWHETPDAVPDGPSIWLANEFFDALPVRQFVRRSACWTERFVVDGAFEEHPAAAPEPARHVPAHTGEVLEWNEAAERIVGCLAQRLMQQGGAALVLDYGPAVSGTGDTVQALRHGRPAPPLHDAGEADLTTHVDFAALARVARAAGARVHGPMPQGPFLAELGLFQRTGRLAETQTAPRAAALVQAAQRLAEPDRMGRLFKVLALTHPGLPTPPGFAGGEAAA